MTLSLTMLFPRRGVATVSHRPPSKTPAYRDTAPASTPPCGSIDPTVAPFPIGLAQLAPEDFPGDIARDRVDEINRLRRLEICDARPRPGHDVHCVGRGPGFQDDDRFYRLAPCVVGDADHCRVSY